MKRSIVNGVGKNKKKGSTGELRLCFPLRQTEKSYGLGASGMIATPLFGRGASGMIATPLFGRGASGMIATPLFGRGASGMIATPLANEIARFATSERPIVMTKARTLDHRFLLDLVISLILSSS